jgi:hypothetical protein
MDYQERTFVIDSLVKLEEQFPVDQWEVNGIDIWPVFKNEIWFYLLKKTKGKKKKKFNGLKKIAVKTINQCIAISKVINALVKLKSLPKGKVDVFFSGGKTFRIDFLGKNINRYFKPLIEQLEVLNLKYIHFEFQENSLKSDDIIDLTKLLPAFTKSTQPLNANDLLYFNEFNTQLNDLLGINPSKSQELLFKCIKYTLSWVGLYEHLFKKYRPKLAIGLCYYSYPIYGMNIAAKKMNVLSIDIQHGLQGKLAQAYTFKELSDKSYNSLPHEFWCWDDSSIQHLSTWTNNKINLRLTGNPWISYLLANKALATSMINVQKPIILYSCQIHTSPILNDYLLEAIRATSGKYNWWIRLHPRAPKEQRIQLESLLKENQLDRLVNINEATSLPLVSILLKSHYHISKYSGAVLESVSLGIPTMVLEEVGISAYQHFIVENKVVGIESPNAQKIIDHLESHLNLKEAAQPISMKKLLEDSLQTATT